MEGTIYGSQSVKRILKFETINQIKSRKQVVVCYSDIACTDRTTEGSKYCNDNSLPYTQGDISIATPGFGNNTSYYTARYVINTDRKFYTSGDETHFDHVVGVAYPVAFHIDGNGVLYLHSGNYGDASYGSRYRSYFDSIGRLLNPNSSLEPFFRRFINNPTTVPNTNRLTPTLHPDREF